MLSNSWMNDSAVLSSESITYRANYSERNTPFFVVYHEQTEKGFYEAVMFNESITSQVTYVTLVPRGNETLRRNARGTPSALSSSESYV